MFQLKLIFQRREKRAIETKKKALEVVHVAAAGNALESFSYVALFAGPRERFDGNKCVRNVVRAFCLWTV